MPLIGKILITINALGLILGAPIADMSETHQYNPRWPPHAKFHNGQTITLSILLGLLTLYYTWRPSLGLRAKESLNMTLIFGSLYWIAGLCAWFFPEANGLDPEFGGPGFPQAKLFVGFMAVGIMGWIVDRLGF